MPTYAMPTSNTSGERKSYINIDGETEDDSEADSVFNHAGAGVVAYEPTRTERRARDYSTTSESSAQYEAYEAYAEDGYQGGPEYAMVDVDGPEEGAATAPPSARLRLVSDC